MGDESLFMFTNPFDALGLPATVSVEDLLGAIEGARDAAASAREVARWEALRAELLSDAGRREFWLLTSLGGGGRHRYREVMSALLDGPPLERPGFEPGLRAALGRRLGDETERARQIGELVELPELEHRPAYHDGLTPRGGEE